MDYIKRISKGDEGAEDYLLKGYWDKKYKEVGDYHTPSDKWIIQKVEPSFGQGKRKDHSSGFFLKTKGGTFSTRGRTYGRWGQEGKVKDLKNGNNTITRPK